MNKLFATAASFMALTLPYTFAQTAFAQAEMIQPAMIQTSCHGTTISGIVRDSTLAVIPGASLTLDGARNETSGSDGRFRFACVGDGPHRLAGAAQGFAAHEIALSTPHTALIELTLKPEEVDATVEVDGSDGISTDPLSTGTSQTISGSQLQALADDPDDLLSELNQLAAAAGGNPSNTTISVDGFQDSASLPPKSSIAYIKVNPDQFSAEYREPPFEGGRVEIYTKPGQKTFHGALFATNSSPWENSRDPFSTTKASLGKQRYGFELTGPVRKTGSDFAMNLEHRSIDNFAVVNAVTLDSAGNTVSTITNVPTPQRLWVGLARLDWQFGQKNTFIASYSANQNHLANLGVGGNALAEAGYDSEKYDHMIHLSNITTASARLMHEARLSLRWNGENDLPASSAPSVQVSGAFTAGGATIGAKQLHRFITELDDDAILTTKQHTLKFGTQFFVYDDHDKLPTNFNGAYTFGGGTAPVLDANNQPIPGQTETITGIEQYRRAQLGLSGGSATAYQNVVGTPTVNFTQVMDAVFLQDDWNAGHGLHISGGVRYFIQNNPVLLGSITPRFGVLWSPTKKGTWTLHAHVGTFAGRYGDTDVSTVRQQDGVQRISSTIYNPVFNNPFLGATPIHSIRRFASGLGNGTWAAENIGGTRALPHGWNLSADYYIGRFWNQGRSPNINSPLDGSPTGPRPGAANLNVLEMRSDGQGRVNATFAGIEQHTLKHAQFFFGAVRVALVDDTDDSELNSPQSSTSNAGELAPRSNQPVWNLFGNGTFTFPQKIQLSADFTAGGDAHYNITTGFDNNGDGNFNDRPQYAAPGTPGAIPTPFGLLTASGGIGVLRRNQGVMPWTFGLDTNLQRAFSLTRNAKADHPQTLTVNLRSANVLNHTNVTTVGGVLGSPLFGVPNAANPGRRVEAGVRYTF
ncbi:hypothetical protein FTO74_16805 [Granulicella sp. WH15]|uniref:TonB-dependent receptor n=1 Tax=Granulicella sp. WH15 TaxID=2602070 RepID=UPI0013673513|nr:TonB-dependent receptor [Granulicella sp. WH15]QHN04832.1 hypothetical protein FTO74_16805 [Granulicella sp. WH15]